MIGERRFLEVLYRKERCQNKLDVPAKINGAKLHQLGNSMLYLNPFCQNEKGPANQRLRILID